MDTCMYPKQSSDEILAQLQAAMERGTSVQIERANGMFASVITPHFLNPSPDTGDQPWVSFTAGDSGCYIDFYLDEINAVIAIYPRED